MSLHKAWEWGNKLPYSFSTHAVVPQDLVKAVNLEAQVDIFSVSVSSSNAACVLFPSRIIIKKRLVNSEFMHLG